MAAAGCPVPWGKRGKPLRFSVAPMCQPGLARSSEFGDLVVRVRFQLITGVSEGHVPRVGKW